jgi:hypothetical protein
LTGGAAATPFGVVVVVGPLSLIFWGNGKAPEWIGGRFFNTDEVKTI